MPATSTAALPASRSAHLTNLPFIGRSFAEYVRCFDLVPSDLRGRPVLDVAAGASSFTAEACRCGIDAVAVDPLYGLTRAALSERIQLDDRLLVRQRRAAVSGSSGLASTEMAPDDRFVAAERERRAAALRFLDDYEAHFVHGRYFGASLPQLPFFDGAFDVVLCAHLLFVHGERLDVSFHVQACQELVRVCRQGVRVYPVVPAEGEAGAEVALLRHTLGDCGIVSELRPVAGEPGAASGQMLLLRRAA